MLPFTRKNSVGSYDVWFLYSCNVNCMQLKYKNERQ